MSSPRKIITAILPIIVAAIGMIAFSQALSFGRWNEFKSAAANHDGLGFLVAGIGIGLVLLLPILLDLRARVEKLEDV